MKIKTTYFLTLILLLITFLSKAQLAPASIRCVSVNSNTNTITWVIPTDPTGVFTSYEIWWSSSSLGPFVNIGTVNTYAQNFFVHTPANGSVQSQYYYVIVNSNGGTLQSVPSNTLRSVYMNLVYTGNGVVSLSWNATQTPLLPSASTTYTLSREFPTGTWTPIYTGSNLSYKDTIYHCTINYNYKVETSDAMGCVSQSNIKGGVFNNKQPPNPPSLDSISVNSNGSITLGWQPSNSIDAVNYFIYSFNGVTYTQIGSVTGGATTFFTYTNSAANSGSESYCIAASDSCGNICIPTVVQKTIFLTSSFDLCSRGVNLSWTSYGNLPQGISNYDVYCSVNGGIATIVGSTTSNTFNHSNLNPGDTYCYFIKVKNTPLIITANSNVSCQLIKAPLGPTYVYIKSVSVNTSSRAIEVTYTIDNSRAYKGATIFKSLDGITFTQLMYQAYNSNTLQTITDTDVKTLEKNYYYKIQISDSCGNPGAFSNTSKSMVLHVSNDTKNIFYNTLSWDAYSTWLGNVDSYNIYRAVNGVFNPTPIANVGFATFEYVDNVEDLVSDQGKFSYYIEAVEGAGNPYNFTDVAKSNPADAYVEVSVFVPNSFAPKGLNSVWLPIAQYVEKTDYSVKVFDRWGSKVFETHSDTEGWTGNGSTDDVYVYLIDYKNARGEYIQLKGHIYMMR